MLKKLILSHYRMSNFIFYLLLYIFTPSFCYKIDHAYTYLTVIHDLESNGFHGFGSITSVKVVLTSCRCVGRFEKKKGGFYEFENINASVLTVYSYDGGSRGVESVFVNGHCRPTHLEGLYIYDLGGLRVNEPFDVSFQLPPPLQGERIENIKKSSECFSFAFALTEIETIKLKLLDSKKCTADFCKSSKIDCSKLNSTDDDSLECSVFEVNANKNYSFSGSPIVCRNTIWGVVSHSIPSFVLWSRIDLEPNKNFYDEMKSGKSTIITSCSSLMILLVLKNLYNVIWPLKIN